MKIGNIVIQETLKVDKKFNVVTSIDDIIEGLPTLVVGLQNALAIEPELNYLDRFIDENIHWTFNREEKRVMFEEDLFYFIEFCYFRLIKTLDYKFIDIILSTDEDIKSTFIKFKENENIISFQHEAMIYIFDGDVIYGVDTNQIKYLNRDLDKFINKVKKLSKVFLDNETKLTKYNNELEMFNNEIKYVPVLYSLNVTN